MAAMPRHDADRVIFAGHRAAGGYAVTLWSRSRRYVKDLPATRRFAMTSVNFRGLHAAALAAALCFSTAAAAQDGGSSPPWGFDRLFNRPQAPVPQGRGQQAPGQEESAPDQVLRIERLENQLRQATGQIEQLQYRNQQLEAQIRAMGGTAGAQPGGAP